jgi:transcription factor IIIB subunit 2
VWLEDEMDPPAFTKAKEKAYGSQGQGHGNESGPSSGDKTRSGRKKRKRKRDEDNRAHESEQTEGFPVLPQLPMDLAALNEAILAGTGLAPPLFLPDYDPTIHIDPSLLPVGVLPSISRPSSPDHIHPPVTTETDETASMMIAEEVATFLQNSQGSLLSEALEEAQRRRQAQFDVVDELQGLDEEELDRFLLTQDEVRVKERVWVELNRDYLEAIAGLCLLGPPVCL